MAPLWDPRGSYFVDYCSIFGGIYVSTDMYTISEKSARADHPVLRPVLYVCVYIYINI